MRDHFVHPLRSGKVHQIYFPSSILQLLVFDSWQISQVTPNELWNGRKEKMLLPSVSSTIVKMACERDDMLFMLVEVVMRFEIP